MADGSVATGEDVQRRLVRSVGRDGAKITRISAVDVAEEAKVPPAALLLPRDQALDRRARDDGKRHPLPDVGGVALPGAQKIRAHGTGALALRSEHIAVDHERPLVAEQPGEIDRAILALEAVVTDHRAAGGQRPPLRGDALDMTS